MLSEIVAARQLLKLIHAPSGAVSVWPWHENDGSVVIRVDLYPNADLDESQIPHTFEGFRVEVQRKSRPVAMSI